MESNIDAAIINNDSSLIKKILNSNLFLLLQGSLLKFPLSLPKDVSTDETTLGRECWKRAPGQACIIGHTA